jgi:hypothetical protein
MDKLGEDKFPLKWPDGVPRTRFQDRASRPAWKKNYTESVISLEKELKRLGATSWLITRNEPHSEDQGVSVYLSTKPIDDYSWQEALGFIGEVPTVKQIDLAYMERVRRIHPDGPTPDRVMFDELTKHRDRARAWAQGKRTVEHEKVLAVDAFRSQAWNITAIRLTISALRQIERCGSPVMVDRAWRGFHKQLIAQPKQEKQEKQEATNEQQTTVA